MRFNYVLSIQDIPQMQSCKHVKSKRIKKYAIQRPNIRELEWSFPGGSEVKVSACNAGDQGSIPGQGRFPRRRKWQPTPVFLPGESHGRKSLVGYRPPDHNEQDSTERLHFHFHNNIRQKKTKLLLDNDNRVNHKEKLQTDILLTTESQNTSSKKTDKTEKKNRYFNHNY